VFRWASRGEGAQTYTDFYKRVDKNDVCELARVRLGPSVQRRQAANEQRRSHEGDKYNNVQAAVRLQEKNRRYLKIVQAKKGLDRDEDGFRHGQRHYENQDFPS
jgi:hypothetical protein